MPVHGTPPPAMVPRVLLLVPVYLAMAKSAAKKKQDEWQLHEHNWDEAVKGKQLFIKFWSPSCGHCLKMKPAWKKLEKTFETTPTALIAGVDCEGQGQSLCEKLGIESYPTLKYGTVDKFEEYEGDRDFKSLQTFVEKKVVSMCGADNPNSCNAERNALLEEVLGKSKDELKMDIKETQKAITKARQDFKQFGKDLHARYEQMETGNVIDKIKHLPQEQQVIELERINREMAEKEDPLKRVERAMKKIKKEHDAAEGEVEAKIKVLEDKIWAAKSVLTLKESKKDEL